MGRGLGPAGLFVGVARLPAHQYQGRLRRNRRSAAARSVHTSIFSKASVAPSPRQPVEVRQTCGVRVYDGAARGTVVCRRFRPFLFARGAAGIRFGLPRVCTSFRSALPSSSSLRFHTSFRFIPLLRRCLFVTKRAGTSGRTYFAPLVAGGPQEFAGEIYSLLFVGLEPRNVGELCDRHRERIATGVPCV